MEEKQRIRDEKRNARRATKRERRIVENANGTESAQKSEKSTDPKNVTEKSANEKVDQKNSIRLSLE